MPCHRCVTGPAHPFQKDGLAAGLKNHRAGHVEDTHLHSFAFDEQYNTYHSYGYAAAPEGQGLIGAVDAAAGGSVYGNAAKRRKTAEEKAAAQERKQRLQQEAQAQLATGQPFTLTNRLPWADKEVKVRQQQSRLALLCMRTGSMPISSWTSHCLPASACIPCSSGTAASLQAHQVPVSSRQHVGQQPYSSCIHADSVAK